MFSRLQHHFRASQNRLGRKGVSLFPGHSLRDSSVRHRFDKHEHIGRRTAADSSRRIHQPLGDELCSAKTVGKFPDLARVLLRHLLVDAHACHSFPYLRRGIRHQTDDLHGSCAGFLKPLEGFAGSDPHQDLILCEKIPDLFNHFLIKLRLYRQKKDPAFCRHLAVIHGNDDSQLFPAAGGPRLRKIGHYDLIFV